MTESGPGRLGILLCPRVTATQAGGPEAKAAAPPTDPAHPVQLISVDRLVEAADNPRKAVGDVSELAESIAALGILEPLIAAEADGDGPLTVVAGHRRLAAARRAGLQLVPVIVRQLSDAERCSIMLTENLQREGLTALEEAAAYRRLVVELGVSQRELARRVGRSQSHISKRMALLQLPAGAQAALDAGGITLEDAGHLQKLVASPERIEAALRDDRRRWDGLKGVVGRHLQELELEAKRSAKDAELRAAGHKVLPTPRNGQLGREAKLRQRGDSWRLHGNELPFSVERHAPESCHAAVLVSTHNGDVEVWWVCTNPDRHGPKGASSLKLKEGARPDRTPEEIARAEAAKAEREAARARRALMQAALAKPADARSWAGHVVDVFLHDANHAPAKFACELLGVEVPAVKNQWGSVDRNPREALRGYAYSDQGADNRIRAALALAFGIVESSWCGYGVWTYGAGPRHAAFLNGVGWEPTPLEAERLAGRDTEEDDDDPVAACRVCGCTEEDPCEGGCTWVPNPDEMGDLCSRCAGQPEPEKGAS